MGAGRWTAYLVYSAQVTRLTLESLPILCLQDEELIEIQSPLRC